MHKLIKITKITISVYCSTDGCHFSHFGRVLMHSYEMDKAHGLLCHIHSIAYENMEVIVGIHALYYVQNVYMRVEHLLCRDGHST